MILPDYQGIGLGTKLLSQMAKQYKKIGRVAIVTSAKNMINALNKNPRWKCTRYDVQKIKSLTANEFLKRASRNVKTATFEYIGM